MRSHWLLVFALGFTACADPASSNNPVDAAADMAADTGSDSRDMPQPDQMKMDLGVDLTPSPDSVSAPSKEFVIDRIFAPATAAQAKKFGIDLDGNGTIDNALGTILAAISQLAGSNYGIQETIDESVSSGKLLQLLRIHANNFTSEPSALGKVWPGKPVKCCTTPTLLTQCMAQAKLSCFSGNYSFSPKVTTPMVSTGKITAVVLGLGPSTMQFQFELTYAGTLDWTLKGGRILGTLAGSKISNGRIVGAIPSGLINRVVAMLLTNVYKSSTPVSAQLGVMFDLDKDGIISTSEVAKNLLAQALLVPDVDVDKDGQKELSTGLGFSAVGAKIK